ncbi:MAG: carboxypeptidase-like regulatory domain-containing protein, partial [Acidobacteriota bacterium]
MTTVAVMAQDFRGQLTGRVTESSGAAVTNAKVVVTNRATGVATNSITDENGDYKALFLLPGSYSVEVEATGFKKIVRNNIEIRVGDRVVLDLALEVGALQDVVNITAETPLLEAASASAGQVIDQRR